jgi:hypothetical protein
VKSKLPLLVAALAILSASSSFGYALLGDVWTKNRTVVMNLSLPDTRGKDGLTYQDSCQDALNTWNQYLAHLQFRTIRNSPLDPTSGDADNSVFFAETVYDQTFGSAVAVTLRLTRNGTFSEADVIFNSKLFFDDYRGPLYQSQGSTVYDVHRVALHEFGHVVGLDHPDQHGQTVPAIMNSRVSDIDALQQDDIDGAKSLYDTGPAYLSAPPAPNLVNVSTRASVAPGDDALIGGFIVQGSQPATVILRAIGHSLRAQGITAPLTDPVIELHSSTGAIVASNDDWITANQNAETIASYHLDPANSRESALLATLNPGSYTAVIHAFDNGDGDLSGTALFELFDLHATGGRAGNLSTRGQVLSGDGVLIGGFIIGAGSPKTVAARGLGPSLGAAGVAGALSDPVLELRDASGTLIASNDNWQQDTNSALLQSEGLAPTDSRESALQSTLAPGNYTAIVRGNNGATGIGLVELYDLSPPPQ